VLVTRLTDYMPPAARAPHRACVRDPSALYRLKMQFFVEANMSIDVGSAHARQGLAVPGPGEWYAKF